MKRAELKQLIKECLIEILMDSSPPSQSFAMKDGLSRRRGPAMQPASFMAAQKNFFSDHPAAKLFEDTARNMTPETPDGISTPTSPDDSSVLAGPETRWSKVLELCEKRSISSVAKK